MPKKALIITAHPSSLGLTHRIAEAYKKGALSAGASVEIIDLYNPGQSEGVDLRQGFLSFENIRETPTDAAKAAMQKKIADADELVFVHPIWWLGPPAILKNWIDVNFSARFAFRYEKRTGFWSRLAGVFVAPFLGKAKRIGMLKGKTACVFVTCDGSFLLYLMMAMPFWSIWHFAVLYYCGIRTRAFRILDKKSFRPEADWNRFLAKVERIGSRISREVGGK